MNWYKMYLQDYKDKSMRAIKGRQKAITARIEKTPNWEESLARGHFSDAMDALRALQEIIDEREERENANT